VVVAAQHERLWKRELADVDSDNVLVQPRNLGTGPGVLLPLMAVLERDPRATVAVLPSDHFVEKEEVLASVLREGIDGLAREPHAVALLGIAPDSPEPDYGWIVPRSGRERLRPVEAFQEKPPRELAAELIQRGGLWNSFVFAARGLTLAAMYDEHRPELLDGFESAFEGPTCRRAAELEALYASIAPADFSRDLLEPSIERLRVLDVPPCGWTDLGTPARVRQCIGRLASRPGPRAAARALDLERRLAAAVP
jgi:mannose-1-phosphate guanylyltransferase